jgi:hypothetical protein
VPQCDAATISMKALWKLSLKRWCPSSSNVATGERLVSLGIQMRVVGLPYPASQGGPGLLSSVPSRRNAKSLIDCCGVSLEGRRRSLLRLQVLGYPHSKHGWVERRYDHRQRLAERRLNVQDGSIDWADVPGSEVADYATDSRRLLSQFCNAHRFKT